MTESDDDIRREFDDDFEAVARDGPRGVNRCPRREPLPRECSR